MDETAVHAEATWRADHLRTVSASDWARRYKARSFELIDARPGARTVDIGCGLGEDALALARIVGPTGSVVGVDRDPEMLKRARAADVPENAAFQEADAHALPFPDSSFDGARVDRVLQHAGDAAGAIREMARVLRIGGRGVAIEPDWGTYAVDLPERALARRVLDARADAFADGWVGRTLYRLFHEAGFRDVEAEPFHAVMTDVAEARRAVDLAHADQFGMRAGTLSGEDSRRWAEVVAAAEQAPIFFATITMFMVAGTR